MLEKNEMQCGRVSQKTAIEVMNEYAFLLDEIAMMLGEKLIPAELIEKRLDNTLPDQDEFRSALEFAIRLLKPKNNRNFREDAILAYAEKRLNELDGKGQSPQRKLGA